jgi:hypothetical protein
MSFVNSHHAPRRAACALAAAAIGRALAASAAAALADDTSPLESSSTVSVDGSSASRSQVGPAPGADQLAGQLDCEDFPIPVGRAPGGHADAIVVAPQALGGLGVPRFAIPAIEIPRSGDPGRLRADHARARRLPRGGHDPGRHGPGRDDPASRSRPSTCPAHTPTVRSCPPSP